MEFGAPVKLLDDRSSCPKVVMEDQEAGREPAWDVPYLVQITQRYDLPQVLQ